MDGWLDSRLAGWLAGCVSLPGPAAVESGENPSALRVVQLYEEVRKSLERCDVQNDIDHFINLRRTGEKPAGRRNSRGFCATYWSQLHTNQRGFPFQRQCSMRTSTAVRGLQLRSLSGRQAIATAMITHHVSHLAPEP